MFILFRRGLKVDGTFFCTYQWLNANFRNAVGPRMGLSLHVPNVYLKVIFN